MASRYRISFSDSTEQQNKSGRTRSWLFGGWRSRTKREGGGGGGSNSNNTKISSHHKSSESNNAKVDIVDADDGEKQEMMKMNPSHEEDEEEDHYQVEEEAVDKEADHFIGKVKSKMAKERLISMKRYESMLNRGV